MSKNTSCPRNVDKEKAPLLAGLCFLRRGCCHVWLPRWRFELSQYLPSGESLSRFAFYGQPHILQFIDALAFKRNCASASLTQ